MDKVTRDTVTAFHMRDYVDAARHAGVPEGEIRCSVLSCVLLHVAPECGHEELMLGAINGAIEDVNVEARLVDYAEAKERAAMEQQESRRKR